MKFNKKVLVVALAAALPWIGVHAQSNADLLRQIEALKAQLEALTAKVEAVSKQAGGVNPQEFNRLVQKVDLVEENSIASGFMGLKFKGVIDVSYVADRNSAANGFDVTRGNGGYGSTMFEIAKESEDGVSWTLRLVPQSSYPTIVHEASVSVPVGSSGTRINAGFTPDYSGYEFSMGNVNPLISNNLLYTHTAASNYLGFGMSYQLGKDWTAKWMVGQVDGLASRRVPGFAYRADYSAGEFSGVGFSGVHFRTNTAAVGGNADLMEIDAYRTRGDLTLQGQFSVGRVLAGALDLSGADAKWWGVSGLVGYKLSPRLQAIARLDFINNRRNGGGVYFNPTSASGLSTVFGPELDNTGVAPDPTRGANRYALSTGLNYSVNENTQWKTELRIDRSTGFNFETSNGVFKKSNTTLGTGLVVSF